MTINIPQVIIYAENDESILESKVNKWLSLNSEQVQIVTIQYAADRGRLSVLIMYKSK